MVVQSYTPTQGEITIWFQNGDPRALNRAIALLYQDLKSTARHYLKGNSHQTIQPTALVHEAYMVLAEAEGLIFENRRHFFNCASLIMRQAIGRYLKSKKSLKHGGKFTPVTLDEAFIGVNLSLNPEILLALEKALSKLQKEDGRKYQMVTLRFYLGLNVEEVAAALELTPRTVRRDWAFAKTWLVREMGHDLRK